VHLVSGPHDLVSLSAIAQRTLLHDGQISAVELVGAHLERINALNPQVNAIVTVDAQRAVEQAAAADALPPDRRGPLHGLPIAIKDTVQTAGMRTTFGHPLYTNNIPPVNDLHVERILDAGAILIGKTNVPEFAAGSHTVNRVFGPTRNPHDLTRSAGGSSGGAAAALAAHFVPIADGSDMGGSLRNPASLCGVVGMRPTPGLVADRSAPNGFNPLVTIGPMARSVSDVMLLWSVLHRPLSATSPLDLRGMRVAYAPDLDSLVPVDPDVRDVLAATAGVLERAGAHVEHACPDLTNADVAFRHLRAAEFDANWHELAGQGPDVLVDFLAENVRAGAHLRGRDVIRAYEEITRLTRAAEDFFARYDLVLAPASQLPAFPLGWDWPREVDGVPMTDYLEWMRAAWLFTPLGIPTLSLPAGHTRSGLPVGAQLLTRAGSDETLLRIALSLEQILALPHIDPLEGVTPHES
jgi:amidase